MVTPKTIALSCVAAAVIAVSTPAAANWKAKAVEHEDLNLSTAAGQQRLATRIKSAVKQVCASPSAFTLAEKRDLARCEGDAMTSAMPKVERTIARYKQAQRMAANDKNDKSAIVGN